MVFLRHIAFGLMVTILTTLGVKSMAMAAPESALIDSRWTAHNPSSVERVDHSAWGSFLSQYVRANAQGVNVVDYTAAKQNHGALKQYLSNLQAIDPTRLNRDAQMSYWINLYNAVTVDLVLDAYPTSSIKRVRGGVFRTGPWDHKVVNVAGQALSLNNIEHGILRPIWRDPRIHYAVNCASIGCPNLALRAYEPETLNAMLDEAARAYVNHPRGAQIRNGKLTVSSIYHWYAVDFGQSDMNVIAHLRQYADPAQQAALSGVTQISGHDYDWALNDAY